MNPEEIKEVLSKHLAWRQGKPEGVRAYLGGAYLRDADLRGAYLRDADLRGAYLGGAYLGGADLGGAYLGGAYLGAADLRGADLRGADLRGADLGGAYLRGAYLRGAYLGDAVLPTGENWSVYTTETLPALLAAGGKTVDDVVANSWECHSWENCPMAYAFDGHGINDVPVLLRPRAEQFVQFFDAHLLDSFPQEWAVAQVSR